MFILMEICIMKYLLLIIVLFLFGCAGEPNITDADLDGNVLFDPSHYSPEQFLISKSKPNPTEEEKQKPVIIVAHGYTATTFEWNEFKSYVDSTNAGILVSQVLLGGHGRTYQDFKNSSWRDWQASIIDEYQKLVQAGYRNISFAGSSTGGPLIVNLFAQSFFKNSIEPKHVFLIDPIIVPSNKSLSMIGIFGPMLGYIESGAMTDEERKHWYKFRPQETLQELLDICTITRKGLESGIRFPISTNVSIYKSLYDDVVDRVSAVMLYNGIETQKPEMKKVSLPHSGIHVITRLEGRANVTEQDRVLQKKVFDEMIQDLKSVQ
jgi:carboxylesterase